MIFIGKKTREKIRRALVMMYRGCHFIQDPVEFTRAVEAVATIGVWLNFTWSDIISAKDIPCWEKMEDLKT